MHEFQSHKTRLKLQSAVCVVPDQKFQSHKTRLKPRFNRFGDDGEILFQSHKTRLKQGALGQHNENAALFQSHKTRLKHGAPKHALKLKIDFNLTRPD